MAKLGIVVRRQGKFCEEMDNCKWNKKSSGNDEDSSGKTGNIL
jgi:hypothetical protein